MKREETHTVAVYIHCWHTVRDQFVRDRARRIGGPVDSPQHVAVVQWIVRNRSFEEAIAVEFDGGGLVPEADVAGRRIELTAHGIGRTRAGARFGLVGAVVERGDGEL